MREPGGPIGTRLVIRHVARLHQVRHRQIRVTRRVEMSVLQRLLGDGRIDGVVVELVMMVIVRVVAHGAGRHQGRDVGGEQCKWVG